jgi:hypothetical protein
MAGGMNQIEHIVYLMLENRSIDNVLGWLYADTGNHPQYNIPAQNPPVYYGLEENKYFNLDASGQKHYVTKGTGGWMNVPSFDPYEEYEHVNNQLFESEQTPVSPKPPTMGGFYKDFATIYDSPYQIMQTYTPGELKVINGLARQYAVSDAYYASVPTQTNCNRAFAATGNSLGLNDQKKLVGWVNNHFGSFPNPKKLAVTFNQRTLPRLGQCVAGDGQPVAVSAQDGILLRFGRRRPALLPAELHRGQNLLEARVLAQAGQQRVAPDPVHPSVALAHRAVQPLDGLLLLAEHRVDFRGIQRT